MKKKINRDTDCFYPSPAGSRQISQKEPGVPALFFTRQWHHLYLAILDQIFNVLPQKIATRFDFDRFEFALLYPIVNSRF